MDRGPRRNELIASPRLADEALFESFLPDRIGTGKWRDDGTRTRGLLRDRRRSNQLNYAPHRKSIPNDYRSGYEAMILTREQAYAVLLNLQEPERTLTLLASGTGLRISECLGLQWQDISFADAMIHLRRTWTCGQVGLPKSKASKGPVPLHPLLAEFMLLWKQKTTYSQAGDWVFPSTRLNGKQPRV